jgi:hypothetical protein
VAAMVTDQPQHQIYFPYLPAKWLFADLRARTPILTGAYVSDILGAQRVEGIEITRRGSGQKDQLACDTLVFTGDWIPEHELARLGGLTINPGTRGPQVDTGFHTSTPGVFAAGNLLRGAETADVCALEGMRVAARIHQYLKTGGWPAAGLPIQIEPPITWMFPNVVPGSGSRPVAGGFTFRVQEFCHPAQVNIQQGEQSLYTQSFRHCSPNDSIHLGDSWIKAVNPVGEPLRVSLRH